MSRYSFPNQADDVKLRLVCNMAAQFDVHMNREFLDSALGTMHELKSAYWPEGKEVYACSVFAMQNAVIICHAEDSGHEALSYRQDVYDAVTRQVGGAH